MREFSQDTVRKVGGFGGSGVSAYFARPTSIEELQDLIVSANRLGRKVALRGSGRSYGDAAYLAEELVVDMRALNSASLEPETSFLDAMGGATLEDVWRLGLPQGFWPPVVSGTMFPTLGGALAMNIHGKNNFAAGVLGEHVESIEVVDGRGELRQLNQPQSIKQVVSSAGLLGAIVRVKLRLKKVASGNLDVHPSPCRNWSDHFAAFEKHEANSDYMVSWIDAYATGQSAGRGLFHSARHVSESDAQSLDPTCHELPSRVLGLIPKSSAWKLLKHFQSPNGVRFLNSMKQRAALMGGEKPYRQSLVAFSFLLDYVPDWQRMYDPHGFIQYQCFLPTKSAPSTFDRLFAMQHEASKVNSLSVMKRHRTDSFLFSHGVDGYSLAMDFPIGGDWKGLQELCWQMNDVVLDAGGRFYFAKDSTLRRSDVVAYLGQSTLDRFQSAKNDFDPDRVFETDLSRRLEL